MFRNSEHLQVVGPALFVFHNCFFIILPGGRLKYWLLLDEKKTIILEVISSIWWSFYWQSILLRNVGLYNFFVLAANILMYYVKLFWSNQCLLKQKILKLFKKRQIAYNNTLHDEFCLNSLFIDVNKTYRGNVTLFKLNSKCFTLYTDVIYIKVGMM